MKTDRRAFLRTLATAAGAVVLVPAVSACGGASSTPDSATGPSAIPKRRPAGWDPIAFNRDRGNAGAIPDTYLPDINGPDGESQHIGKHLPFVPDADEGLVPSGFVAIMWGDPDAGHARHPNAPRTDENPDGHWYDWIRVRKATDEDAAELESTYTDWPGTTEDATGAYAVFGDGALTDDSGRNTIYLAALPPDVGPGDTVRIHAHCLTHGEYVDFVTIHAST